jgi:hypothetical protein
LTISTDYLGLQRAVADELGDRQDLLAPLSDSNLTLSPIKNAIQSAIARWEREPFYFNEAYTVPLFTTVLGQEFYTTADAPAIATTPEIDLLHVLVNANRYPLTARSWAYLDQVSVNPNVTGEPVEWAYFAAQIRLYPIPDNAYPVRATRTSRFTGLSADTDANVWTEDAYDLVRSEAKLILAREVLFDDTLVARMEMAIYGNPSNPRERGYLYDLKAETTRRTAKSRIKPTYF